MGNSWISKLFGSSESQSQPGELPTDPPATAMPKNQGKTAVLEDENLASIEQKNWWDSLDNMVELANRPILAGSPEEASVVGRVDGRLKASKYTLPVLPTTLIRVVDLANQPDVNFKAIADVLRSDAVIAGEVMSLVNSAAYATSAPIADLQRAIIHVGSRRIRGLALAVAARLTVFRNTDQKRAEKLWLHSLGTAVLARAIARATKGDPEEAFVAGLMHDVGKSIVLGLVAEDEREHAGVRVPDALVERLCDDCHTGVGAAIAKEWKLPESMAQAIEHHHDRHSYPSALVATTALANDICAFLAIGVPMRRRNLLIHPAVETLGLDPEKSRRLLQLLPSVLSEAPEFKGVVNSSR